MKKPVLLLTSLLIVIYVFAHEYILMAYKFRVKKGDDLEIHLFVSDGFNIQLERPIQKPVTKKFELITTDSDVDLTTQSDQILPVINRKVNFDGGGLIHMERNYSRITLETNKFLEYLNEEHIENIADKVDKTKANQKERYSRYIKTLVQSGDLYHDTLYKKITGQAFEIVLLQNPYTLHKGDSLKAKILFQNKPFTGKIITARNRIGDQTTIALTAKTDGNGICSFLIGRNGDWFLHATHMISCPDTSDSDWESFWTSYSFPID
jgi:uncharacterized GH25 family protein